MRAVRSAAAPRRVAALRRQGGLADAGFPVLRGKGDRRVAGFVSRRRLAAGLRDLRGAAQAQGVPLDGGAPALLVDPALQSEWDAGGAEVAYVLHGYVDPSPVMVRGGIDVARVVHIFRRLGLSAILVVDDDARLESALTKSALVRHLRAADASQRAPLGSLVQAVELSCGCPGAVPPDKGGPPDGTSGCYPRPPPWPGAHSPVDPYRPSGLIPIPS